MVSFCARIRSPLDCSRFDIMNKTTRVIVMFEILRLESYHQKRSRKTNATFGVYRKKSSVDCEKLNRNI